MGTPSTDQLLSVGVGRLYWAATVAFPDHADLLSSVAKSLAGSLDTLNVQSALAGDPAALTGALEIGGDVSELLRRLVIDLDHGATALLNSARAYVANDAQARSDLNALGLTLPTAARQVAVPGKTPNLAAPGATTDIDIPFLGLHLHDVEIGSTPDPTEVGYEQGQQLDGPDLPDDPSLPQDH